MDKLAQRTIGQILMPPIIRSIFRFRPVTIIPALASAWIAALFADYFHVAYVFVASLTVWAVGVWLTSDFLSKAKAKSEKPPAKKPKMLEGKIAEIRQYKKRQYLLKSLGVTALIFAFVGGLPLVVTWYFQSQWEIQQNFGLLTPADDPSPPIPISCSGLRPSSSEMRIYAGGGLFFSDQRDFTLLSIKGHPIVSAKMTKRGIAISGDIYDQSGDLVHIDENRFEAREDLAFKPERPDRHTLRVLDNWHRIALAIRFLNPHAIRLSGIFNYPGEPTVVIDDEKLAIGSNTWQAPCFGNNRTGIAIN